VDLWRWQPIPLVSSIQSIEILTNVWNIYPKFGGKVRVYCVPWPADEVYLRGDDRASPLLMC
jgi:hypothetical protein